MRVVASILLLALGQPLLAADPAPQPGSAPLTAGATAGGKEKSVCKAQGPLTGSRLGPRRVCRTPAEWAELEERESEMGRIPFTRAVPPPPKPGPGT